MVQNYIEVEGCFFTINNSFEEACSETCEYVRELPRPLPELYYTPIEQPKKRLAHLVPTDRIIQLKQ